MTSAFENSQFNRHCCICHVLNLLLHDLHELFIKQFQNIHDIQIQTKNSYLFNYLCKKNSCHAFKISSYCQTSWYSLSKMIHSFNLTYKAVFDFLDEKRCPNPFSEEDLIFYQEFDMFIDYFKSSIQLFESDKFATISKIHSEFTTLKQSVTRAINNSFILKQYEKQINEIVEYRIQQIYDSYGDIIYATALLNPCSFYSRFLSKEETNKGKSFIKNLIKKEIEKQGNKSTTDIIFEGETCSQKEFLAHNDIQQDIQYDELDLYLQSTPIKEQYI